MRTFVTVCRVLMGSCGSLHREFVCGVFKCCLLVDKVLEKGQGQRKGQKKGNGDQQKQF